MVKVDLHVHTKFSDGALDLDEVLSLASQSGIKQIAITDHDTIINLSNSKEIERRYGLRLVPGVEIAANISGMHILGYGIKNFTMVEDFLRRYKVLNKVGTEKTIEILKSEGIDISLDCVEAVMTSDIISKRDIVRYMIKRGYANNTLEVYKNYIGRGHKAYVPVHKIKLEDILEIICAGGGFPVLAHPYTLGEDVDFHTLIPYMMNYGLKGIEANTVRHTQEQKVFFSKLAQEYNLIETAGTDFHQPSEEVALGVEIEEKFLDNFNKLL